MLTIDEHMARASPDTCFRVAADVEKWPDILPHYRWVTFQRKEGFAQGLVEMAAWRHFGPLGYPTWWVSEMQHDPERRVVLYKHIDGITRGMDVRWEIKERPDGMTQINIIHEWDGPRWPMLSRVAANWVIGPQFVSHIAQKTLAGVVRAAEGLDGAARND